MKAVIVAIVFVTLGLFAGDRLRFGPDPVAPPLPSLDLPELSIQSTSGQQKVAATINASIHLSSDSFIEPSEEDQIHMEQLISEFERELPVGAFESVIANLDELRNQLHLLVSSEFPQWPIEEIKFDNLGLEFATNK